MTLLETLRSYYRDGEISFPARLRLATPIRFEGGNGMKRTLSLDALTELARAYLKSAWIGSPQWDSAEKAMGPHFTTRHCNLELRCPRLHRHAENRSRHQTPSTADVATVPAVPSHPSLGRLLSQLNALHEIVRPRRSTMKHTPNPRHRYHRHCQCEPCRSSPLYAHGAQTPRADDRAGSPNPSQCVPRLRHRS